MVRSSPSKIIFATMMFDQYKTALGTVRVQRNNHLLLVRDCYGRLLGTMQQEGSKWLVAGRVVGSRASAITVLQRAAL